MAPLWRTCWGTFAWALGSVASALKRAAEAAHSKACVASNYASRAMPSFCMRLCSVLGFRPSNLAAPSGP